MQSYVTMRLSAAIVTYGLYSGIPRMSLALCKYLEGRVKAASAAPTAPPTSCVACK